MAQLGSSTVFGNLTVLGQTKSTDYLYGKVDCISGQMGTTATISGAQLIPFDDFWISGRGITYSAATKRFTVSQAGLYRITFNPFFNTTGGPHRVMIGKNTDVPTQSNHIGHTYSAIAGYNMGSIDSLVQLNANDYIVFYLFSGSLYNGTTDRFNQFSIMKVGE